MSPSQSIPPKPINAGLVSELPSSWGIGDTSGVSKTDEHLFGVYSAKQGKSALPSERGTVGSSNKLGQSELAFLFSNSS